jgi:isocitrate/isopropylmalate dehydrogenase
MLANDSFHIAVLRGDGIGSKVMAPALEVLHRIEATTPGLGFRFTEAPAGAGYYRETGRSMPESTIKLCREATPSCSAAAACRRCAIPTAPRSCRRIRESTEGCSPRWAKAWSVRTRRAKRF